MFLSERLNVRVRHMTLLIIQTKLQRLNDVSELMTEDLRQHECHYLREYVRRHKVEDEQARDNTRNEWVRYDNVILERSYHHIRKTVGEKQTIHHESRT